MLIVDVDSGGKIVDCNDQLPRQLERPREAIVGTDVRRVLDPSSAARLTQHLVGAAERASPHAAESLVFVGNNDKQLANIARIVRVRTPSGYLVRILAVAATSSLELLESLQERTEILEGFMEASSEAMWCIEFTEAVNLNQNDSEIVHQVFNNERHWMLCNEAMARLYGVPAGVDIHDTPVSMIFPQNPANEHFVRQLIAHGFTVDRSPSIDMRHDGSVVYVENNVRGHIEDAHLHRMWGTARDITEFKRQQQVLSQSEAQFRDVLSALPDAVILVTQNRDIRAVNPAFELLVGAPAEAILDHEFTEFLPLPEDDDIQRRWHNGEQHRWRCEALHASGVISMCEARLSPVDNQANRFVIVIRPTLSGGRHFPRQRAQA